MPAFSAARRRLTRSRTSLGLTAALAGALLAAPVSLAAPAHAAGAGLVISEVYGGGGNSGAALKNDFVELYNSSDQPVSLDGTSLQYRAAGSTGSPGSNVFALSGTVQPGAHWLVAAAKGAGGSQDLPAPDATSTLALGASGGQVYLVKDTAPVTLPAGTVDESQVIDFVGWGSGVAAYEGSAGAPATSNATSVSRTADGTDTDDNAADFTTGAPSPEDSGDQGGGTDPGQPTAASIAEIQGTGASSPMSGQQVVTSGVVTAVYATGGFQGFTVQTPGTGGAIAGRTASDGLFVYAAALDGYPTAGQYVSVTGKVSEFHGLTELTPSSDADVAALPGQVRPPRPLTGSWPTTAAGREAAESMLYAPTGPFTVTDNYSLNQYGEIALAAGDTPLRQPTDVARPGSDDASAVAADNAARAVTLDDGDSTDYLAKANQDIPLPWITRDRSVRVGAAARFTDPVVVDYRNDLWKLQPTAPLTGANPEDAPATFSRTRTPRPAAVGGRLKVASFNVLNYFRTTGAQYEAAHPGACTSYDDRDGVPITVKDCGATGPRGAWGDADLQRQQTKIVKAINALGADVLGLEEIENSVKQGKDRDAALAALVDALNADAGSRVWGYVPTPPADQLPPVATQDVIRVALIYKVAKVDPVGDSHVILDPAFDNARQSLGHVFVPRARDGRPGNADQRFLVVVNHFKSKGSAATTDPGDQDDGDGQGASNATRVAEAKALVDWVGGLKSSLGVPRTFLAGDFNSYTQEDPMQVLYRAGYTDIGSTRTHEYTYVYDGLVGSLDHVLADDAALRDVTGAAIWNINSVEPVAYEYSRHNENVTDLYAPNPFRSSDHDPLLVGFDNPTSEVATHTRLVVAPRVARVGSTRPLALVQVRGGRGPVRQGTVVIRDGDRDIATATVRHGIAQVRLPAFTNPGSHRITATYQENAAYAASTSAPVRVPVIGSR